MMQKRHVILLAAGQGKRMGSDLPKVLQPLAGRSMLDHTVQSARSLNPEEIHVVVGYKAEQVIAAFSDQPDLKWIHQTEQLGTGHATEQALPAIPDDTRVLVLFGDSPLIQSQTLHMLADIEGPALLSAIVDNPNGYGRIVRSAAGEVEQIVEHKDANAEQLAINEVNSGIFAARAGDLKGWLKQVDRNNEQGEYYLTDVVAVAVNQGIRVHAAVASDSDEILGANNLSQLATLERIYQQRQAQDLCARGVRLIDPQRFDLRGNLEIEAGVQIDANVLIEGECVIEAGCVIGFGSVIKDSHLGPGTQVKPYSVIEGCVTEGDCDIGPYARIRPGSRLAKQTRIGNFVETKNAEIGTGSKVNHLSYVGDAKIGETTNVGAGTITCNYDGVNKHKTTIGDRAFIGSNTALVAPVNVGDDATIGAGSTITKDAPDGQLSISRAKQIHLRNWKRPEKKSGDSKG